MNNPANYSDLDGKVVVITGGANGIGEHTVKAFLAQGAKVFTCDVDAQSAKSKFQNEKNCYFSKVNLTSESQITKWIKSIGKKHKRIDVLVNNAARDPRISLEKTSVADWDGLMNTNLRSYFLMIREASEFLIKGSSIINFSSLTFHEGPAEMSAYVATKAGIQGLTRSLARELGPRRIRVNTVSPGWVMTERQLQMFVTPTVKKRIKTLQCIPDLMQPDDLANVVLFLASNTSCGMTGQELLVDRGWQYS